MPSDKDLSGKYEAVIQVSGKGGAVQPGATVELSHEDAKAFLSRGLVTELKGSESSDGGEDQAPDLSVPADAGRDALLAAGYTEDAEVSASTDEELLALDGIGAKTLEKIREILPNESE